MACVWAVPKDLQVFLVEGWWSERCQGDSWVGWAVGALVPEFLQEAAEEGVEFRLADVAGPFAEEEAAPDGLQQGDWVVAVEGVAEDVPHCLFEAVEVGADLVLPAGCGGL